MRYTTPRQEVCDARLSWQVCVRGREREKEAAVRIGEGEVAKRERKERGECSQSIYSLKQ